MHKAGGLSTTFSPFLLIFYKIIKSKTFNLRVFRSVSSISDWMLLFKKKFLVWNTECFVKKRKKILVDLNSLMDEKDLCKSFIYELP